jgi:hypothetical protein
MDEQKIKTTLLALIGKVEDLEASQAAAIALLIKLSKGSVSASDVRSTIGQAKSSGRSSFDKLRKTIAEISSDLQ